MIPKQKPAKRDAKRTQERLRAKAEELFVKKGYHAVAVDEIAAAAGVNKRMIYVYFGSKEKLYEEVIASIFRRIKMLDINDILAIEDFQQRLEAMMRTYFNFLRDNPTFVRLLAWETLYVDKDSIHRLVSQALGGLGLIRRILSDGVAAGHIRKDMDVRMLSLSINSLFLNFFNLKPLIEESWGKSLASNEATEAVLNHTIRLVCRGMLPEPEHA